MSEMFHTIFLLVAILILVYLFQPWIWDWLWILTSSADLLNTTLGIWTLHTGVLLLMWLQFSSLYNNSHPTTVLVARFKYRCVPKLIFSLTYLVFSYFKVVYDFNTAFITCHMWNSVQSCMAECLETYQFDGQKCRLKFRTFKVWFSLKRFSKVN